MHGQARSNATATLRAPKKGAEATLVWLSLRHCPWNDSAFVGSVRCRLAAGQVVFVGLPNSWEV